MSAGLIHLPAPTHCRGYCIQRTPRHRSSVCQDKQWAVGATLMSDCNCTHESVRGLHSDYQAANPWQPIGSSASERPRTRTLPHPHRNRCPSLISEYEPAGSKRSIKSGAFLFLQPCRRPIRAIHQTRNVQKNSNSSNSSELIKSRANLSPRNAQIVTRPRPLPPDPRLDLSAIAPCTRGSTPACPPTPASSLRRSSSLSCPSSSA